MIEGQLNSEERRILFEVVRETRPEVVLEVGTWKGGGSTLHILRALEANGYGHLWGIEASREVHDQMIENIRLAAGSAAERFTPMFGLSQDVIPNWLLQRGPDLRVDFAFLDGGDNPAEQITEFRLLAPLMPVGAHLMSHDAHLRKGKWLVPYMAKLDNWETGVHDVSREGLHWARKTKEAPSRESLRTAEAVLRSLRLEPSELVAIAIPKSLKHAIFKVVPKSLLRRLTEGRI